MVPNEPTGPALDSRGEGVPNELPRSQDRPVERPVDWSGGRRVA